MNFVVFSKRNSETLHLKETVIKELTELGFKEDNKNPEVVFVYGGDGTFLNAVHEYQSVNPIFVGINCGNLGYYCDFKKNSLKDIVELLKDPKIEKIPVLETVINGEKIFALNEIRVESLNGTSTAFKISVNDKILEDIRADGICIATPNGSTGIARSMGGSLIDTKLSCMEIIEKLPIHNAKYHSINSPIIIDSNSIITLSNFSNGFLGIYYDSKYIRTKVEKINVNFHSDYVKILKNSYDYIDRLREDFYVR